MEIIKKERTFDKKVVGIIIAGVIILFAMLMIYTYGYAEKDSKPDYPESGLSNSQGSKVYEIDEEILPFEYHFEDIPYSVGVPTKGILYVEGGYVYNYNSNGLIVAEVATERTLMAYTQDVYGSLYAIKEQPSIVEVSHDDGFLNGYQTSYDLYKVSINEENLKKTIYQIAYLFKTGDENILLLMNTENIDNLVTIRDFLVTMSKSLVNESSLKQITQKTEISEDVSQSGTSSDEDETPRKAVTREALITAELDYEEMFLTFYYMDVSMVPQEIYVLDKNDIRYDAVEMSAGSVSFLIPTVSEGDDIKLVVTSENLKGTTVEQMEYKDHLKEIEQMEEGTLHVEEDSYEEESSEGNEDTEEDH